jgi:hypothetical protein
MNQVQFLREQLVSLPASPNEAHVNSLVATYLLAKEQIESLVEVQADAKLGIRQVIEATGITRWETSSGLVTCPNDSTIVTYDAGALDRLAAAQKAFYNKVWPFRKESVRAGGIRIAKK